MDNLEKRRQERFKTPVCHNVLHPLLGQNGFKDTCPMCGYKKPDGSE